MAMKYIDPKKFNAVRSKTREIVFCKESATFYNRCMDLSLKGALNSLKLSNVDGELSKPIEMLKKLEGNLYNIMCENVWDANDKWIVMCHGDLWINNLMFQKDLNGKVVNVKLLDLQTPRYTNPVIDILQFLYSSTEKELRLNHLDQLIFDYRESLIENLKIYLIPKHSEKMQELEAEFTCENIKTQFQSHSIYGLGISFWLLPAVTFHPECIPNLDNVTMNDFQSNKQEDLISTLHTNEYHTRLREVVLEYYSNGYLDTLVS